jgi:beta-xylosidase
MKITKTDPISSDFEKKLKPVGRILESPDYNVWGCSPIRGDDGKVHVFYSRWKNEAQHQGWITCCEIAHAIADTPEGPFETIDVAVSGRGGDWWDSMTCHNPTIHKVGDKYALFYMGTSDGTVYTKRVGMATSDSLYGPWKRTDKPIIEPDPDPDAWNSVCTTNPAFVQHPNGEFWLYYKSWCITDWEKDLAAGLREATVDVGKFTNRQYGLAKATSLEGPWKKVGDGPIIDLSHLGENAQSEDAYIWIEDGKFRMIMRDMGYWNHEYGLMFESADGINWGMPTVAFYESSQYIKEPPNGLEREGRLERTQILMKDGKPDYVFFAMVGGKYSTCSGVVLKVDQERAKGEKV